MYEIPTSININDRQFNIRKKGDYRMVLDCFNALCDIELTKQERILSALIIYYEDCNSLEDINLENVKIVGEDGFGSGAFEGCTSLKTANLESAIKIHERTFSGCTSLENVKLDNLEVLGREAFDSCTALQKVELPSIKYLGIDVEDNEEETWWAGGDAFVDCHALETLILGSSLIKTNIGYLFEGCENLKDVYCYAINPPLDGCWEEGDSDYRNFIGDFVLHVPAGSIEAYRKTHWGEIYQLREGYDDWYESVGYRTIVAIED